MKRCLLINSSILLTLWGCNVKKCSDNINQWITQAPEAFRHFELVKREILSNNRFVDSLTTQGVLFIGLNTVDTSNISESEMPYLKGWFKKGYGYINIEKDDTSACFIKCSNGGHLAYGNIELINFNRNYDANISFLDSVKLSENYKAVVWECIGCED